MNEIAWICETIVSFIEDAEEHGINQVTVPISLLKATVPSLDATSKLSTEDVRKMVIISDDDWVKATLQAYADILEGTP